MAMQLESLSACSCGCYWEDHFSRNICCADNRTILAASNIPRCSEKDAKLKPVENTKSTVLVLTAYSNRVRNLADVSTRCSSLLQGESGS